MQLTREQIERFNETGYLLIDRFLPEPTIERYRIAYMETVERLRADNALRNGAAADDSDAREKVYQLRTAHRPDAAFDEHIRNPAFLDVVQSLIGRDIQLVDYQGLYKPPHTGGAVNWHQDDFDWRSKDSTEGSVSLWVPLDDATVDNGCMWYVPGSHHRILHHDQLLIESNARAFTTGSNPFPPRWRVAQSLPRCTLVASPFTPVVWSIARGRTTPRGPAAHSHRTSLIRGSAIPGGSSRGLLPKQFRCCEGHNEKGRVAQSETEMRIGRDWSATVGAGCRGTRLHRNRRTSLRADMGHLGPSRLRQLSG